MDISKYKLFVDIADTKNFTKSSDRIGYTQSGVSHVIKTMERELGFSLFTRTKHGVTLTSDAERILPLVRKLLSTNEELNHVINSINDVSSGHVTIATFASISRHWLPSIIHTFKETFPNIEVELLEGGTDEIIAWIENNKADFGLLNKQKVTHLEWIPLYNDPLVAVLPVDYPLENKDSIPISDMQGKPFIMSAKGVDYDIHDVISQAKITPDIHFSSRDDYTIISMVSKHLGISILPQLVIGETSLPIKIVPLQPAAYRQLGIALRSEKRLSPATKRFLNILKNAFPEITRTKKIGRL